MRIAVPKETDPGETRVSLVPADAAKLIKLGAEVEVESGLGEESRHSDSDYLATGAMIARDRRSLLESADLLLRLHRPSLTQVELLKAGSVLISFVNPFGEPELMAALAARGVSALSLEQVPRIASGAKHGRIDSTSKHRRLRCSGPRGAAVGQGQTDDDGRG